MALETRTHGGPRRSQSDSEGEAATPASTSGPQTTKNGRQHPQYVAPNPHVVNQIVDRDLCVRCGACEPACPVDIIRFGNDRFPLITDEERCIQNCTRCLKVCPGEEVDFLKFDQKMFGVSPHPQSVTGIVNRALVSFSTDDELRRAGTSGGFVTQLLIYMLERGIIDGALVVGASDQEGKGWDEKPFIARTVGELRGAVKSKYRAVPHLRPLGEMEQIEGNYAVVALPCYVHALRKYQRVSPKLRKRLKLVIGLYCNVTLEPFVFDELCDYHNVEPRDVVDLQFRGGEWPGGVHATLRDGTAAKLLKLEEMKDEFNLLKSFYTPTRCNMCTDFSVEHADLAVGDPWLRGPDGRYLFPDGRTSVLTRTKLADQIIDAAAADGYLSVQEIPVKTYMMNFERSARYKRDFVPANIALRKLAGLPTPDYNRPLPTPSLRTKARAVARVAFAWLAKRRWFRMLGLRLAQLPPALAYFRWNRKRKQARFQEVFARQERFVLPIMPPPSQSERETSGFEER